MNTNYSTFKNVLAAYNYYNEMCSSLKKTFTAENYGAIKEYDSMANEVLQVLIVRLLVYLVCNYDNADARKRQEAFFAAQILAAVARVYLEERGIHQKQIILSITEITHWFNKLKDQESSAPVERREIKNMVELYNKFKKNALDLGDKVVISKSQIAGAIVGELRQDIPEELQTQMECINQLDIN